MLSIRTPQFALALALSAVTLAASPAFAAPDPMLSQGSLAVLDFKIPKGDVSVEDARYFTDVVRGVAVKDLPNLKVITRENLLVLLQATGKDISSCEGECEVDTGRRIGADLIISGDLLKVGSSYRLNLRLHETRGGQLLNGEIASGHTIDELNDDTKDAVTRLLAPLRDHAPRNDPPPLTQYRSEQPPVAPQPMPARNFEPPLPSTESPTQDTPHRHLGFQFHIELGGGYMTSIMDANNIVTGAGPHFAFEIGGATSENTIVSLRVGDSVELKPSFPSYYSGTISTAPLSSVIIGPSITQYFMPINLFLSASVGVSSLRPRA